MSRSVARVAFVLAASFISCASLHAQEVVEVDQFTVDRGFDGNPKWENYSPNSSILTIGNNNVLRLREFGGWSQFFILDQNSDHQLVSIVGERRSLDGSPSGWAGFGISYYDVNFNRLRVFETEIFENVRELPLNQLRYNVSARRPADAVYANIWVWNAYDNTELVVDEFSASNAFPANEYTISNGIYRKSTAATRELIANGSFAISARFNDGRTEGLYPLAFWETIESGAGDEVQFEADGLVTIGNNCTLWQEMDIQPLSRYSLTSQHVRELRQGAPSPSGQPWSAIGVDLYDANWNFVSKFEVQTNTTPVNQGSLPAQLPFSSREFTTPAGVAHAVVWAWQGSALPGANIPLRIQSLSLRKVVVNDTSPPTVEPIADSITQSTSASIFFAVYFKDASQVNTNLPGPEFRITGKNGFTRDVFAVAGGPTPSGFQLVFPFDPIGDAFGPEDNGTYNIRLLPNQVADEFGNVTPEQALGTITIDIK